MESVNAQHARGEYYHSIDIVSKFICSFPENAAEYNEDEELTKVNIL